MLYYPIKPWYVTQSFGQNLNAIYKQKGYKGHSGIDIRAYHGQPIYASCGGTCYPEIDDAGGNGVLIRTPEYQFVYWHMLDADAVVQTGQVVKAGDLIGYADSTGISTGDHLHFGIIPLINRDANNGYNGAVDPQPFFNGKYAEEINNPLPEVPKYQFTRVLRLKAWNNDVKQLQILLEKLDLYKGSIDGIFGKKTEQAVKEFQTLHQLVPDGIVGKLTNKVLNSI